MPSVTAAAATAFATPTPTPTPSEGRMHDPAGDPAGAAAGGQAADAGLPISELRRLFDRQRLAYGADRVAPLADRQDRLARLLDMTDAIGAAMAEAISADFGHRPRQVTRLADELVARAAIRHAQRHLRDWMRVRRVPTALPYLPGKSRILPQPLGVVGIVSPWNYPYQLAICPAVAAIAAGNRVLIKPSEATPRFAALLRAAVAERFAEDELAVVPGDAAVGRAFVSLPFDHLLFTGSTAVGRQVALAAAANLTPVTLELGGKSPAILNADCDLADAATRVVAGKLFNNGQTCIAPDYLLVHESLLDRLGGELRAATERMYPTFAGNSDRTSIIDARHAARLQGLLDDAAAFGATVLPLHAEAGETALGATVAGRHFPPFAVLGVDDRMAIMRQEIFGPLLPVVPYRHLDEAVAYVNAHDRPLALYWFGRSAADRDAVLQRTVSGGVTVNDCLLHVVQEGLPFGGVGASGCGRYHGVHGFRTFSHEKPVFHQSRHSGTAMMAPPYGRFFDLLERLIRRLA